MTPGQNIVEWSQRAPWAEQRQVEQDLIISRALVEIFDDAFLAEDLRFRGGTALNKLHFPEPLRYSEDIDLVRTSAGAIGPILDRLRELLEPWLGPASFAQSQVAPKFRFRVPAEDGGEHPIRLKLEINTRELAAHDPVVMAPFAVENPWFTGASTIPTFSNEEMLATKLRVLLQRDKGRDLYDLAHGLEVFGDLDCARVVELFARYLADGDAGADEIRLCQRHPSLSLYGRGVLPPLRGARAGERHRLAAGHSGALAGRAGGQVRGRAAEALDRISRVQADVASLYKHFTFAGVMLVTLAEGEISELPVGRKGTMNALFLKDLAAKIHRGLRGRGEKGQGGRRALLWL